MKKNKLVIIGAGGHGRVVADIAKKSGAYGEIVFLDDSDAPNEKVCVVGKVCESVKYLEDSDFFVAIGNNRIRADIQTSLEEQGANFAVLVHPNASIGDSVELGKGSAVMAGTVINSWAKIGKGVVINTCSSVDHDCVIDDFTHVSVGAHIAGSVRIGKKVFVCAGVTVINNVNVCDECVIGAGAVVISDVNEKGTYVGVPVHKNN